MMTAYQRQQELLRTHTYNTLLPNSVEMPDRGSVGDAQIEPPLVPCMPTIRLGRSSLVRYDGLQTSKSKTSYRHLRNGFPSSRGSRDPPGIRGCVFVADAGVDHRLGTLLSGR